MAATLADHIFKCIFLNENDRIAFQISLQFVLKSPINSIGSGNGLAPNRRQPTFWNIAGLINWRIYASLGGDGLANKVMWSDIKDE